MRTVPYINFHGRAREAMEYYHGVLGGRLELRALGDKGPGKAGPGDRIAHGELHADGATVVASDGHPDYPPTPGDNMAIFLAGPDRERLAQAFTGLADGGMVQMPLAAQPWGVEVGWLRDRFGVHWTVVVEPA